MLALAAARFSCCSSSSLVDTLLSPRHDPPGRVWAQGQGMGSGVYLRGPACLDQLSLFAPCPNPPCELLGCVGQIEKQLGGFLSYIFL